jgi:hypothetical protein
MTVRLRANADPKYMVFQKHPDLWGADRLIRAGRPRPALLKSTNSDEAGDWRQTAPTVPEKGSTTHFHAPPPRSESSVSKIFRHSGMPVAFKTTFEVFTRVGPNNSLERLTERSIGLVTDRPSDVYNLFVTLL